MITTTMQAKSAEAGQPAVEKAEEGEKRRGSSELRRRPGLRKRSSEPRRRQNVKQES
jgi:hypothetical protein